MENQEKPLKVKKHPGGRPTVMTKETIDKLEAVFSLGGTDTEACFFAGISHQTLYDYQAKNPEYLERKEALREKPILKARQTVVKALENPADAQWFLERKRRQEFGKSSEEPPKLVGNVYNLFFNPEAQEKVRVLEAAIKDQLIKKHESTQQNKETVGTSE